MGCPANVVIGDSLVFAVCTHDPDTGAQADADDLPIYRVYEDETATPILTGSMAKLDDGNTVGFYTESIACTVANGFEEGKSYTIYIKAEVDSDPGSIAYAFKCEPLSSIATAVWDALTTALTTVGSIGRALSAFLTGRYRFNKTTGVETLMDTSGNTVVARTITDTASQVTKQ